MTESPKTEPRGSVILPEDRDERSLSGADKYDLGRKELIAIFAAWLESEGGALSKDKMRKAFKTLVLVRRREIEAAWGVASCAPGIHSRPDVFNLVIEGIRAQEGAQHDQALQTMLSDLAGPERKRRARR